MRFVDECFVAASVVLLATFRDQLLFYPVRRNATAFFDGSRVHTVAKNDAWSWPQTPFFTLKGKNFLPDSSSSVNSNSSVKLAQCVS